uniref:PR domain zinc finger protein 15 n=1 Tax=Cacopsylla melanoneura TaxID=428564 RepID=A0A8D8YAE0_9HEMI
MYFIMYVRWFLLFNSLQNAFPSCWNLSKLENVLKRYCFFSTAKLRQFYRNLQHSSQMNMYRRQMIAASMPGAGNPQLHLPTQPAAAFDAWSKIAFLNSNPMAKQATSLRGLLSVKSNHSLGLNRNININIAQNIHLNPTVTPPPTNSTNTNLARNLIAEKNTRIRNEINRMIYSSSVTGNSVDRYACNKCNRSYRNKNHLYRHVRYECDRKKRYQCGICMKDFYRKDNLKTHISYKHSEYKSSNFILINKEEEVDDEMQLDAHNNNNLVISKNELNDLLNKNDNSQQVLSILNNNESTKHVAPSESAKQFLHLKLKQEQNNLQKSLLLRIQTENNKITQSQSDVLSKLLSSKVTPVQLNLPSRQLEIHNRSATPTGNKSNQSADVIDLEGNNDTNYKNMPLDDEDDYDDDYVQGIEPFVHIDIDSYNDVDTEPCFATDRKDEDPCNNFNLPKKVYLPRKQNPKVLNKQENDCESNSELKSILTAKTLGEKQDEYHCEADKEKKTDAEKETSELTEKASKEQFNKTESDDTKELENKDSGSNKATNLKTEHTTNTRTEDKINVENDIPDVDRLELEVISTSSSNPDLQVVQ